MIYCEKTIYNQQNSVYVIHIGVSFCANSSVFFCNNICRKFDASSRNVKTCALKIAFSCSKIVALKAIYNKHHLKTLLN